MKMEKAVKSRLQMKAGTPVNFLRLVASPARSGEVIDRYSKMNVEVIDSVVMVVA